MKKLFIPISVFVFLFLGGFAADSRVAAQDDVAGGYADASVRDKDVRKAANFAVKQRSKIVRPDYTLVSIRKAELQVVAGLNYRICMRVRDERGRLSTVTAVVYKNLRNKLSLSRWRSGGCREI
ncbi:MAG TPA: cystatin domain-containing protein [Pyrinomonadaceae bacterium]|nr:cystatin domain-containing protein [Pyrinomonadaceae bacterium]